MRNPYQPILKAYTLRGWVMNSKSYDLRIDLPNIQPPSKIQRALTSRFKPQPRQERNGLLKWRALVVRCVTFEPVH